MKEIEILYELKENTESVVEKIKNYSFSDGEKFELVGEMRVVDTYYRSAKFSDLNPNNDSRLLSSFRVREKNGQFCVTHKQDIFDEEDVWAYSNELETSVGDINVVKKILKELHFCELVVIDNVKKLYESGSYEIAIESVVGLGDFIEIEYVNKEEIDEIEALKIKQTIRDLVSEIGFIVGAELNSGKPELMLKKNKNN